MLADEIARMIEQMLDEEGGALELRRNEMAMRLGCVPSQISYVITSRFTPERGYLTESRRGGGGHIRIVRKKMHRNEYLMHFFFAVGQTLEEGEARAYLINLLEEGFVTEREAAMANAVLSAKALSSVTPEGRSIVRADLFKHLLLSLMQ